MSIERHKISFRLPTITVEQSENEAGINEQNSKFTDVADLIYAAVTAVYETPVGRKPEFGYYNPYLPTPIKLNPPSLKGIVQGL